MISAGAGATSFGPEPGGVAEISAVRRDDGTFIAAWVGRPSSTGTPGVYVQVLDTDGAPLGAASEVAELPGNAFWSQENRLGVVATPDGGYAVAWGTRGTFVLVDSDGQVASEGDLFDADMTSFTLTRWGDEIAALSGAIDGNDPGSLTLAMFDNTLASTGVPRSFEHTAVRGPIDGG